MEFKFLHVLAFLYVAIVAGNAKLPSEDYWNSVLPNTPMPKVVKDLLQPSSKYLENESTNVGVGRGGVNVNTGKSGSSTRVNVSGSGIGFSTRKDDNGTGVYIGGINVTTTPHNNRPPVHVWIGNPFNYNYGGNATQLHDDPTVALFFLQKDLQPGRKMYLKFSKTTTAAKFLPQQAADSVPFSSEKLPEIYSRFSVNTSSDKAKAMRKTIQECEETAIKGEEKACATSLESMIDFTTSKLGKEVMAISTNAENTERKEYHIMRVKKMPSGKPVVACHRQEYAYAVFYCHKTNTTVAYEVEMVADGRSKAVAVAVCHQDTAAWNPKHLAFQVLKVKPGSVPVCHFLPEDHIVWVSKN